METSALSDFDPISFTVISSKTGVGHVNPRQAFLREDRWDDWGKYCTQFWLIVIDEQGIKHEIGSVKIGQFGLKPSAGGPNLLPGHRIPDIPHTFTELDDTFFSVGQEDTYYENLSNLGDAMRDTILASLHDVAADPGLWQKAREEDVMGESLLRSVTTNSVERQFRRMAQGGARLTSYSFTFTPPKRMGGGLPALDLEFDVEKESKPPTNVHVLIGRNGVGKTHLLNLMTESLAADSAVGRQSGRFSVTIPDEDDACFANLVTVSFSAFDRSELLPEGKGRPEGINYSYIGLRRITKDNDSFGKPKTTEMLAREFVKSLGACQIGGRKRRWSSAMRVLESDPVFKSAGLRDLIDTDLSDDEEKTRVLKIFGLLSSGHSIVLLALTRLVETVEEKTLVLIDEPEAHLHPPLLSAFIRALSNLLFNRNGVAIIATHSPVVLQEVPRTCVLILNRSIRESQADRPPIETFGENVGILTREVFQLELTRSGFHQLLEEAVLANDSYQDAVESFHNQLGSEAKAVLRAMFLDKESQ